MVTGSELVRGDRNDLNGPYLAASLLSLGIEPALIAIVGDREEELEAAFRIGLQYDVLITSGGLGPTHDDRTVEVLARVAGIPLSNDEPLRAQIEERSQSVAARLRRPYSDFAEGVLKQARVPEGATVAGLAGTAPAVVVRAGSCLAVALPGPPRELQALWARALETAPFQELLAGVQKPERRVIRYFGVSESAVAQALADAGGDGDGVEATICAREFEIHVDLIVEAGADRRADALEDALTKPLEAFVYVHGDERGPVEEIVLALCRHRGLTLATAESCTGGMVAERLTGIPGASDVFLGAVVAYADEVKAAELGVPEEMLRAHGAVSPEVAAAMARGVRERFGTDLAVSVTG
ncbi:MAG TPA: nicotinamide-nucleotide amidohydrolase family protein, partial [Gaiellaceae bacterium]|nr:nicotinamide-nucleotide amidohydrolase family protein [Gaiellaceae bacterium]